MDENKKKVQTDDGFDVRQIDVHELLLQQEPFVFIDQLTYYDERLTTSIFRVSPNHLYVEEGKLQTCALAEVIAQTCAARIGYINKYILKRTIQMGFIGAIRNLKVYATPLVGDLLETQVEIKEEIMGMLLVEAQIKRGEDLIAEGTLKMSLTEQPQ